MLPETADINKENRWRRRVQGGSVAMPLTIGCHPHFP